MNRIARISRGVHPPLVSSPERLDSSVGTTSGASSPVHILICTNGAYFQHAAVCLTSLLANNPELSFNIIVVARDGEYIHQNKLRRSLKLHPSHVLSFRNFVYPQHQQLPLNPQAHYTVDIWTRLWLADFFGPDVRRVLYLDSDLVVVGSIAPLWHLDLNGALLAAADIPGAIRGTSTLGLRSEDGYFNSGVLLVDLEQWRRTRALETVLEFVAAFQGRLNDPDQDALNACFSHRRKRLEYRWNAIWPFFREPPTLPLPRAEIEAVRRDARIIHFNGSSKPWSYFCDHPCKQEYDKYLRMTEWRDFVPSDKTPLNILRKHVSAILPDPAKTRLKALVSRARS